MEYSLIWYILVAFFLSALGSIPTGMIAISVIQRTIENGTRGGVMVIMGAFIMEFVYTYVALSFLDVFKKAEEYGTTIQYISIVIFLLLGIYYLSKKVKPPKAKQSNYDYFDFGHGFIIGALNLLIIPFWMFAGLWLESNDMKFNNHLQIFAFSLSATLGASVVFLAYVKLGEYVVKHLESIIRFTDKVIGVFFFLLAAYQIFQIV